MKLKWQWFSGGQSMFWVSSIIILIMISAFICTFIIDLMPVFYMRRQDVDSSSIELISKDYVQKLDIIIDKPIKYNFVKYKDPMLLGTFHEWNSTYYIDISVDLYKSLDLKSIVIHETRHMVVEYLTYKRIIDLRKYSEEIAEGEEYYSALFDNSVYLLNNLQKEEE